MQFNYYYLFNYRDAADVAISRKHVCSSITNPIACCAWRKSQHHEPHDPLCTEKGNSGLSSGGVFPTHNPQIARLSPGPSCVAMSLGDKEAWPL